MYGVRARGADGSAHGVLLFNSNGMDVVPAADRLTYRAVGGVLDLFFLLGPTPLDVMDQLTRLVGRPALPAYWALGLMNSKRAPARRRSDLPPGPLLCRESGFCHRVPLSGSALRGGRHGRLRGAARGPCARAARAAPNVPGVARKHASFLA